MAAIYQKARPYTFAQVIGQEHIKEVLSAALSKGRIGHAYLFSGPRGVGKTTMARLLSMAVNCEHLEREKHPCGECEPCLLVRHGNHPDIIELDAASNNSVDDIRDLREKVNLASLRGGTRVWILDEAHMLTKSAANAFLKTLEEPPSKLMFILATTEPEKLPPTILSRCQHYRFRRLSEVEIARKLNHLCQQAGVSAAEEALALVARAADGAMRDGESLLERLLTPEKSITKADAEKALGLPPQDRLQALARHLVKGDLEALFKETAHLYHDGFAPRSLSERLKLTLRDALYGQIGLAGYNFKLSVNEDDLLRLIHALDDEAERFIRYDDLFSLEVALIKTFNSLKKNLPNQAVIESKASATGKTTIPEFNPTERRKPLINRPQSTSLKTAPQTTASEKPKRRASWHDFLRQVNSPIKAFLIPASPPKIEDNKIYLNFPSNYNFHFEQLKSRESELWEFVVKVFGEDFSVHMQSPKGKHVIKSSGVQSTSLIDAITENQIAPVAKTIPPPLEEITETQIAKEKSLVSPAKEKSPIVTEQVTNNGSARDNFQTTAEPPTTQKTPLTAPEPAVNKQLTQEKLNKKRPLSTLLPEQVTDDQPTQESSALPPQELSDLPPETFTSGEALPPDLWENEANVSPVISSPVAASNDKSFSKELTRVLELFPGEVTFTPHPKEKTDKS